MTTITYRKTKAGKWVAFGPAAAMYPGAIITVSKRDGSAKSERIDTLGKPFTVGGQQMVYGYLMPRRTDAGMCEECGERRAVTTAIDMSGISGSVCRMCANSGALSFA